MMKKPCSNLRSLIFIPLFVGTLVLGGCGDGSSENTDPGNTVNTVKIHIEEKGIFRVSVTDLESAGMDLRGKDLRQLHLSLRGVPQSLFISLGETFEGIEFYGRESDSLYSSQNIYILELGAEASEYTNLINNEIGNRTFAEDGADTVYPASIHLEENMLYFPQVVDYDHWFWLSATGGQSYTIPINLGEIAPGSGHLRIGLWGNTETSEDPDHHLIAQINSQIIFDLTWDGKGEQILDATIPGNVLVEGENQMFLNFPADTLASVEVNWINWIEVDFPRYAVAQSDSLQFETGEQVLFLSGFNGKVEILDITGGDLVDIVYMAESAGDGFSFSGQAGHLYYAVGSDGYRFPSLITPLTQVPNLKTSTYEVDYAVIGPENLLPPVNELLAYRAEQGLRVMSIPLLAIYDQYNYGFPEPEAIKNFLIYASQSWAVSPRYVLLVGDASYDPRNYLMQSFMYQLPTFLVQTVFGGQAASDFPFTDVNGDRMPDLALARVPASTINEVQTFVQKTIEYEVRARQSNDQFNILAIADGQEASFRADAQFFLDEIGNNIYTQLFAPEAGAVGSNEAIAGYFEDDYSVVAYFGHGSVLMWGKDQLFTSQNAMNLSNSEYPVIINMTCLTGLFTHPTSESITEAFLFNPSGGAVAVIAPTSLTLPSDQRFLSEPLARELTNGQMARLGEIFLAVQRQVISDTVGIQDVLNTFILFGDPALILDQR
jgi:hypothetical protein